MAKKDDSKNNNPKGKGGFKKGKSGNPGGRPKKNPELVEACRKLTPDALKTLKQILLKGEKDSDRLTAAKELLNRGWGTAPASIEISGPEGGPIETKASINRPPAMTREEWIKIYGADY